MSLVTWGLIGIVAGVTANWLSKRRGTRLAFDLAVGVSGAAVGGSLFGEMTSSQPDHLQPWRLAVSAAVAAVFLAVSRALGQGRMAPGSAEHTPEERKDARR